MKRILVLLVTTLTVLGCSKEENSEKENKPNPIYLDENGFTVKSYDWGEVGDTGDIDGEEFIIISESELRERIKNGGDLFNVVTSKVTNMDYLFYDTVNEQPLNGIGDFILKWDVSNVNSMEGTFKECSNDVISLLGYWDVSNVTNMSHLFESSNFNSNSEIRDPYSLIHWDVSSVRDMSYMFVGVDNIILPFIDNWDVSNVTNMSYMFGYTTIYNENSFENWDVSNVTDMSYMFYNCFMDSPIGMWNVSSVQNMERMMYRVNGYNTYFKDEYNLYNWNVDNVSNCQEFSKHKSHHFEQPNFTNCNPN